MSKPTEIDSTIDPLRHAKKELRAAEAAIKSMRGATSFESFEFAWNDFLARIEKVWEKVEQACKSRGSKFQPWQGKYTNFRRKDALVRYLHQARHADQHTLEESVAFDRGSYSFKLLSKPGEGVHIKSLRIDHGRVTHYEGSAAAQIIDQPARPILQRIKNRGKSYNPPTQHLGLPLKDASPLAVADRGLRFYQDLVEDAELTFFVS
jgi:hypothetical protein